MVWISRWELNGLRRAAGQRMAKEAWDYHTDKLSATGMLLWRLNPENHKQPGELWRAPFEYIHTVDWEDEMVVFILCNAGPLIIRESKALFPSDALVAQCRLLLAGEKNG